MEPASEADVAEQCTKVPDSVLREVLTHGSSAGMLHTVHTHASKLQDDTEEQLTAEDRDEAARWGPAGPAGATAAVCVALVHRCHTVELV